MLAFFKKEKYKQWAMTALVLAILAVGYFLITNLTGGSKKVETKKAPTFRVVDDNKLHEESFRNEFGRILTNMDRRLSDIEKQNKAINEQLQQRSAPSPNQSVTNAPITNSDGTFFVPPPVKDSPEVELARQPTPPDYREFAEAPMPQAMTTTVMTGLIQVGSSPRVQEVKPAVIDKKRNTIIPVGSFVEGVLLSGVDAPTMGRGLSDPVPTLIRITDTAILPNFFKADLKECFVIADAKGNLPAEAVNMRLSTLSCIKTDGTTLQRSVRGYVAGENGKEGVAGRVVSKQGTLLGRAMIAGFLQGVAEAFRMSNTSVTMSPSGTLETFDPSNAMQTAMFGGAGEATKKLADFYMELVSQMVPVVEVNAGRVISLVFLSEINMEDDVR